MEFIKAKYLDRYVGIPVCAFLSAIDSVRRIFYRQDSAADFTPRRILFIGLAEMGSNILAYGAMKKARECFPHAELSFLVFVENKEAVSLLGVVETKNIFLIRSDGLWVMMKDVWRTMRRIRLSRPDVVVDLELFSRFSSILSYLSGARQRVGFHGYATGGLYRGHLQTHRVQFNVHRHIAENFLALVGSIGTNTNDIPLLKDSLPAGDVLDLPCVDTGLEIKQGLLAKLKIRHPRISGSVKIVVMSPEVRTRLPLRRWPLESYLKLTEELLRDPEVWVVFTGFKSDGQDLNIKNDRFVNLIGETSIPELLALFKMARLLVTHDSGAAHLASLTGLETVVMFGPETPSLYAPLNPRKTVLSSGLFCSPCFSPFNNRTSACKNNKCMQLIAVDEVLAIAKKKINS